MMRLVRAIALLLIVMPARADVPLYLYAPCVRASGEAQGRLYAKAFDEEMVKNGYKKIMRNGLAA